MLDDATWWALTVTLTLLGGIWTFYSYRRRGLAAGIRGAGITLLPVAALLTGTLRLGAEVIDSVVDWGARFVFSPTVWLGVILAGVAVTLLMVGGAMTARGRGTTPAGGRGTGSSRQGVDSSGRGRLPASQGTKGEPAIDDDLADIEAILKQRGIT